MGGREGGRTRLREEERRVDLEKRTVELVIRITSSGVFAFKTPDSLIPRYSGKLWQDSGGRCRATRTDNSSFAPFRVENGGQRVVDGEGGRGMFPRVEDDHNGKGAA